MIVILYQCVCSLNCLIPVYPLTPSQTPQTSLQNTPKHPPKDRLIKLKCDVFNLSLGLSPLKTIGPFKWIYVRIIRVCAVFSL